MAHFYKHFKKSDSYMHIYWVGHNGFGFKPKLSINKADNGIYFVFDFVFDFTWWRFHWYWCRGLKKGE